METNKLWMYYICNAIDSGKSGKKYLEGIAGNEISNNWRNFVF